MLIGAIADDLTGAADLALTLSREGMRTIQTIGVPGHDIDLTGADAVVIALKSRTIAADKAVALSIAAAEVLAAAGAQQFFFKYCSTFDSTDKGNIGPVIDALLDHLGEQKTIACPAFPANGRTVYAGHLFVGDRLLSESSMRDHPLTPMRDADLVRVLQRQSRRRMSLIPHAVVASGVGPTTEAMLTSPDVQIVDAITDDDLRTVGAAAADLKLVTGGSGIAIGLPTNFRRRGLLPPIAQPRRLSATSGRRVVLAGSCSAATRRQIETARSRGVPTFRVDPIEIAAGRAIAANVAAAVAGQAANHAPIVYSSDDPDAVLEIQRQLGAAEAGRLVEAFLADVAASLLACGFSKFIVAGGETSGAVAAALHLEALLIGPEIDPGVPWTQTIGRDTPLTLALKSGNFGSDDFFLKAWSLLP